MFRTREKLLSANQKILYQGEEPLVYTCFFSFLALNLWGVVAVTEYLQEIAPLPTGYKNPNCSSSLRGYTVETPVKAKETGKREASTGLLLTLHSLPVLPNISCLATSICLSSSFIFSSLSFYSISLLLLTFTHASLTPSLAQRLMLTS